MKTLVCPNTINCIFYKAYSKGYNDNRLNVIFEESNSYSCLALSAHDDLCSEGGIIISEDIRKRIEDNNVKNNINMGQVSCSHLEILSNQIKLINSLEK